VVSPFVRQQLRGVMASVTTEDLAALADLEAAGRLTPVIDRTTPLGEARGAIAYVEEGHAKGKVVLTA
jgi:NADPH:quinone reductase-like Zn-dependent oxidoreductase